MTINFLLQWKKRRDKIREYDLNVIFKGCAKKSFNCVLEIGAGDGFQSEIIHYYAKKIVSTEYNVERFLTLNAKNDNSMYKIVCDAENLPFKDKFFDMVFSSNVLEHIKDRKSCMNEINRVLKKDGLMIHVMPNRLMKFFNFFLYYLFGLYLLINKKRRIILFNKIKENTTRDNIKSKDKIFLAKLLPPIHGEYNSHIEEFVYYGKKRWIEFFNKQGYQVQRVEKLSISSTYRFGFDRLRKLGLKLGICTSYAYFLRKNLHKL